MIGRIFDRVVVIFANRGGPNPVRTAAGLVLALVAILAALVLFGLLASTAIGSVGSSQCSAECVKRVEARYVREARAREMKRYKAAPMPWCTWGPESGVGRGEWSMARYRQPNVSGGTGGGKFQFILSTWRAIGGTGQPYDAPAVIQERKARVLLKVSGLGAWVNC